MQLFMGPLQLRSSLCLDSTTADILVILGHNCEQSHSLCHCCLECTRHFEMTPDKKLNLV
jgi:hypothetical protein